MLKRLTNWMKRLDDNGQPVGGQIIGRTVFDFEAETVRYELARWRIEPVIELCDFWVGVFVDKEKRRIYILPIPCIGIRIYWG